jgi:N-acetylneuraminic acid mutarotase
MLTRTKVFFGLALLVLLSGLLFAASEPFKFPAYPAPISNNAVAIVRSHGQELLFSFMGVGSKKTWEDVSSMAFYIDPDWQKWYPLKPVPGTAGRLGASAAAVGDTIYLLGGYVVDNHNRGLVVPDVNVYDIDAERWSRGDDIPTPVADSVAGVYRDRYIYLIGGRSGSGAVSNVQVYDTDKSKWFQATPLPGTPVFDHAGALLNDTIVYVDGAYKNPSSNQPFYLPADQCWMGKIDHHDPAKIEWSKLPPHPGIARFGIAAGASEKRKKIYFTGGTDNPSGYTGIGFNGKPVEPSPVTFAFDLRSGKWEVISENTPTPTMYNRAILDSAQGLVLVGGMGKGQEATARVLVLPDEPTAPQKQ